MCKFAAVAAALVLAATTVVPAQAATVGKKCTAKLTVAKSGSTKLYCGKNPSKSAAKKTPLVWKRSADCFDLITAFKKVKSDYDSAMKQINDLKAQIAAVQGDTSGLQTTVKGFEDTVKVFEPTVQSMQLQVSALCS